MTRFDDRTLGAYVDGEASPEEARAIDAALGSDAGLRARIAALREVSLATRAAFAPIEREPPPDRLIDVARSARPGASVHRLGRLPHLPRFPRLPRLPALQGRWRRFALPLAGAAGVAAAVLIGVSSAGLFSRDEPEELAYSDPWLDQVRRSYDAYAAVEPTSAAAPDEEADSGDVEQVGAWFSRRLDHPIMVPDLSAHGLTLKGGKVLIANGEPSAQIIYATEDGAPVALAVVASRGPDELIAARAGGGTNLLHWRASDYGYALIGALDLKTMERLADEIAPRRSTDV
ncbi:MAG: anti-sigma factor [Alphaproteobacteria bacterium]